jgi:hypothetical protein
MNGKVVVITASESRRNDNILQTCTVTPCPVRFFQCGFVYTWLTVVKLCVWVCVCVAGGLLNTEE